MSSIDFSQLSGDLDLSEIDQIVAGGKEKGVYNDDLYDFLNSGKLGQPYPYSGKKAQSVKTGFESAIKNFSEEHKDASEDLKEAAKQVQVLIRRNKGEDGKPTGDEFVFLLNQAAVKAARQAAQTQAA